MQVANNNLFKRLKKRKMKDSILNAYNVLDSKYGVRTFVPYFNKSDIVL